MNFSLQSEFMKIPQIKIHSGSNSSFIISNTPTKRQPLICQSNSIVQYNDWISFNKSNQYFLTYLQPEGQYLQSLYKQINNQNQCFSFFQILPSNNFQKCQTLSGKKLQFGSQIYLRHVQTNSFLGVFHDKDNQKNKILYLIFDKEVSKNNIFVLQRSSVQHKSDLKINNNNDQNYQNQYINTNQKVKIRNKVSGKCISIINNSHNSRESSAWLTQNFDSFQINIFQRQSFNQKILVNYNTVLLFNNITNTYLGVSKKSNIIQIVNQKTRKKQSNLSQMQQSKSKTQRQLNIKTTIKSIVNQKYWNQEQCQIQEISQFCFKQKNTYEFIWEIKKQTYYDDNDQYKSIIKSKQKVFIRHLETGLYLTQKDGVYSLSKNCDQKQEGEITFRLINTITARFQNSFLKKKQIKDNQKYRQQNIKELSSINPIYTSNSIQIDTTGNSYSFLKLNQRPYMPSFNHNLIRFHKALSFFLINPLSIDDQIEKLKDYIQFYSSFFQMISAQNQKNIDQGYYYLKHSLIIFNLIRIKLKQYQIQSYRYCKFDDKLNERNSSIQSFQLSGKQVTTSDVHTLEELYKIQKVLHKILKPLVSSMIKFICVLTSTTNLINDLDDLQKQFDKNQQTYNKKQRWVQYDISKYREEELQNKRLSLQVNYSKRETIKSLINLMSFDGFLIMQILGIISNQQPYIIVKQLDQKLQQLEERLSYLKEYPFGTLSEIKAIQKELNHQKYLIFRQVFGIANSFNQLQYDWSKCLRFLLSMYVITFNKQQIQMFYQGNLYTLYGLVDRIEQDLIKSQRSSLKNNLKNSLIDDEFDSQQQIDRTEISTPEQDNFINFILQVFKIHIIILKSPFRRLNGKQIIKISQKITQRLEQSIGIRAKTIYLQILNSLELNLNINIQISLIQNCQFVFHNGKTLTKNDNVYSILNISKQFQQNFQQILEEKTISKIKSELYQGYLQQKTCNVYFKLNFLKIFMDSLQIFISFGNFSVQFLNKSQFYLLQLLKIFGRDSTKKSSNLRQKYNRNAILSHYFKMNIQQFEQHFRKKTLLKYGNYNIYDSLMTQIRSTFQLILLQKQRLIGYPFIRSKKELFQSSKFLKKYQELSHFQFLYKNFDFVFKFYQFYADCQTFQNSYTKDFLKKSLASNFYLKSLSKIQKIQKIIIFSQHQRELYSQIFHKINKIQINLSELELFLKTLEVIKSQQKIRTELINQIKDKIKMLSNYLSGIRILDGHSKIIKAFHLPKQIFQIVLTHNALQDSILSPLIDFLNLNPPSTVQVLSCLYKVKNQKIQKGNLNDLIVSNIKKQQYLSLLANLIQKNRQHHLSILFEILLNPISQNLQSQKNQSDFWFINKISLIGILQQVQSLTKQEEKQLFQPIFCKILNRQEVQQYLRCLKTFKQFSILSKTFKNYKQKIIKKESQRGSGLGFLSLSTKLKESRTSQQQSQTKKKTDSKSGNISNILNNDSNNFQQQNQNQDKNQQQKFILTLTLIFRIAKKFQSKFQKYFDLFFSYEQIVKTLNKFQEAYNFMKPLLVYLSTDPRIFGDKNKKNILNIIHQKDFFKQSNINVQTQESQQNLSIKRYNQSEEVILKYLQIVNKILAKHEMYIEDLQEYEAGNCFVFPFIDTDKEEEDNDKFSIEKIKRITTQMKTFAKNKHHYWDFLLWNPFYFQEEGLFIFLQLILTQNIQSFSDEVCPNYKNFKNIIKKIIENLENIKKAIAPKKNKLKFQRLFLKLRKLILIVAQIFPTMYKNILQKQQIIDQVVDVQVSDLEQDNESRKKLQKSIKSIKMPMIGTKNKLKIANQLVKKQQKKYKAQCLAYQFYKFLTNNDLLTIFMKSITKIKNEQRNQFFQENQIQDISSQVASLKKSIKKTRFVKKSQSSQNSQSASLLQSSFQTHHALIIPSNQTFHGKVQRQNNQKYKTKVAFQSKNRKTVFNLGLSNEFQYLKQIKFTQLLDKVKLILNQNKLENKNSRQNKIFMQSEAILIEFFQNQGDGQFLLKCMYQSICAKKLKQQQTETHKPFLILPIQKRTSLKNDSLNLFNGNTIREYSSALTGQNMNIKTSKHISQFDKSLIELLQNKEFNFILTNLKRASEQLKYFINHITFTKVQKKELIKSMKKQKQTIKQHIDFLLNVLKRFGDQTISKENIKQDLIICLILKFQVQIISSLQEYQLRIQAFQIPKMDQIQEELKKYIYLICLTYFKCSNCSYQLKQNEEIVYDFKISLIQLYFCQMSLTKKIEQQIFYLVFDSCVSSQRTVPKKLNADQFNIFYQNQQSLLEIMKAWIKQFTKALKNQNLDLKRHFNKIQNTYQPQKQFNSSFIQQKSCTQILNVPDNYSLRIFSKMQQVDIFSENIEVYKLVEYIIIYFTFLEVIASQMSQQQTYSTQSENASSKTIYRLKNSNILFCFNSQIFFRIIELQQRIFKEVFDSDQFFRPHICQNENNKLAKKQNQKQFMQRRKQNQSNFLVSILNLSISFFHNLNSQQHQSMNLSMYFQRKGFFVNNKHQKSNQYNENQRENIYRKIQQLYKTILIKNNLKSTGQQKMLITYPSVHNYQFLYKKNLIQLISKLQGGSIKKKKALFVIVQYKHNRAQGQNLFQKYRKIVFQYKVQFTVIYQIITIIEILLLMIFRNIQSFSIFFPILISFSLVMFVMISSQKVFQAKIRTVLSSQIRQIQLEKFQTFKQNKLMFFIVLLMLVSNVLALFMPQFSVVLILIFILVNLQTVFNTVFILTKLLKQLLFILMTLLALIYLYSVYYSNLTITQNQDLFEIHNVQLNFINIFFSTPKEEYQRSFMIISFKITSFFCLTYIFSVIVFFFIRYSPDKENICFLCSDLSEQKIRNQFMSTKNKKKIKKKAQDLIRQVDNQGYLDRNEETQLSLETHIKLEHNIFKYLQFFQYILTKSSQNITQVQKSIKQRILQKDISLFD